MPTNLPDTFTAESALFGHTSPETAYLVDDYPYGFRLRCKIRYWIETNPKHGDRFVSQTTNPKVAGEHWNKPKASTYVTVGCMFLDEASHVQWVDAGQNSGVDAIEKFTVIVGSHLNRQQRVELARATAVAVDYARICGTADEDERERLRADRKETLKADFRAALDRLEQLADARSSAEDEGDKAKHSSRRTGALGDILIRTHPQTGRKTYQVREGEWATHWPGTPGVTEPRVQLYRDENGEGIGQIAETVPVKNDAEAEKTIRRMLNYHGRLVTAAQYKTGAADPVSATASLDHAGRG